MRGHAAIWCATGARIGVRLPGLPSLLLLDHVCARSDRRRTTPLVYMPDGDDLLVVAQRAATRETRRGRTTFALIRTVGVQIGGDGIRVHAREANERERRRLWPRAVAYNPHWGRCRERSSREIPLMLLESR